MTTDQEKTALFKNAISEADEAFISPETHDCIFSEDGDFTILRFIPNGYDTKQGRGNQSGQPILELIFKKRTGELLSISYAR